MSLGSLFKMCIVCISTVTVASLLAPTPTPVAQNSVSDYTVTTTACPKSKVNKIENNRICLKSGTVYRWAVKKPVVVQPTPTPTPTATQTKTELPTSNKKYFLSPCELDPDTPSEWKQFEKKHINGGGCLSPFRVPKTSELTSLPKIQNNFVTKNILECKLNQNPQKQNTLGFKNNDKFWIDYLKHPSPNTVYQVVPLYSNDIPNSNTKPSEDFKKYFDFLIDWTKQASDNGSNIQIKVPDKYLYFPGNISSYNLIHERKQFDAERFSSDLIKSIDSQINFTNANIVLVLFPPSTNKIVGDQVGIGTIRTDEGFVTISVMPSGGDLAQEKNFSFPTWWIHELMHVGIGFDDNNHSQKDSPQWWGLINWASSYDLLTWHKWIAGYISDSQVICLDKDRESVAYIAPSTVKSTRNKAVVIPIDKQKAIVVESQRAEGINYKLPQISEGALVYLIDMSVTSHADGIRLILPENKKMIQASNMDNKSPGHNSNASLKLGESAVYNGIKITVIESGEFGDVIKVEPTR